MKDNTGSSQLKTEVSVEESIRAFKHEPLTQNREEWLVCRGFRLNTSGEIQYVCIIVIKRVKR